MERIYQVAILTVSDRVSAGQAKDGSGPALEELLHGFRSNGMKIFQVSETAVVPDDTIAIQEKIKLWTQNEKESPNLILTTGGTGFSPRDITPEAISPLLDRGAPGLVISMMNGGLSKTPLAALSRPVAGVRGTSIILTLPGSTKGATENLTALLGVLPHALGLAKGRMNDPHPLMEAVPNTVLHHTCSHGHVKRSEGVALRPRESPYKMTSVADALELVLNHAKSNKKQPVTVKLGDCALLGSVLAESALAAEPVPAYAASVVDGYAVRSKDGPGEYEVLVVSLAGGEIIPELPEGTIARISTGAPVPKGADAVVMVEDTQLVSASTDHQQEFIVRILGSIRPGDNIRAVGSDLSKGATVLPKGYHVGGALGSDLGLLASSGLQEISVFQKPSVGVLSSGNELVELGDAIRPGQVRDANRPTLLAALEAAGFPAVDLGIVPDTPGALDTALKRAVKELDVVVTTGGVSMGEADLIKPLLASPPYQLQFGRVAMKPGKPTTFATCSDSMIFALPGNPVSAAVALQLFVIPALKTLAGHSKSTPQVKVKLLHEIALDSRPEYYRATVLASEETTLVAQGTGNQISSRLMSMAGANALLVLPPASSHNPPILPAGTLVSAILIGPIQ